MAKLDNLKTLTLIQKLGLELTNHSHVWSKDLKSEYNKVTSSLKNTKENI
ncbi:MAG: hypothetical protein ACJAVA_000355 [Flavobacteriaceae bacterium]|jgi:hypothetical protein